jgi:opacity protein-like surface antigen
MFYDKHNQTDMKKIIISFFLLAPLLAYGQFGIKAGLNFSNVTNTSEITNSNETGYNVGIFLEPKSKSILSSKTELIFSKQGYNYSTSSVTGKADLMYIMLPTYMCINITRFFQIHVGAQMAYMINAKADSTTTTGTSLPFSNPLQYYNRFDYGLGGGVEVHPFKGLLVGARVNISLAKLYSDAAKGQIPSLSSVDVKQNLLQLYAGWHFGKQPPSNKKGG